MEEIDDAYAAFIAHSTRVISLGPQIAFPTKSVDGYIVWYGWVSHPFIIPDSVRVHMVER